jgi:hypothetical protein
MVKGAHDRAFAFFRGACTRGVDDTMKTAVDAVFVGKSLPSGRDPRERADNRRFCADVRARPGRAGCVHAGGGLGEGPGPEPGRVARQRLFTPGWLKQPCRAAALLEGRGSRATRSGAPGCSTAASPGPRRRRIQKVRDRTIWEMFEAERPSLVPYAGRFDGFHAIPATVSKTCTLWGAGSPRPRMGPLRQQHILGLGERGRASGRDPGLCRADRAAPGRPLWSVSIAGSSAAARPSITPGTTCRCWRASQARSGTARRSRTGCCRRRSSGCGARSAPHLAATGRWSTS